MNYYAYSMLDIFSSKIILTEGGKSTVKCVQVVV